MGGYHITTIIEMSRRAAGCRQLNWRTLVTTVRTEHAAIARLRTQQNAAAFAVEEIHARIRRHALHRRMSALGACQERGRLDCRCHFGLHRESHCPVIERLTQSAAPSPPAARAATNRRSSSGEKSAVRAPGLESTRATRLVRPP